MCIVQCVLCNVHRVFENLIMGIGMAMAAMAMIRKCKIDQKIRRCKIARMSEPVLGVAVNGSTITSPCQTILSSYNDLHV